MFTLICWFCIDFVEYHIKGPDDGTALKIAFEVDGKKYYSGIDRQNKSELENILKIFMIVFVISTNVVKSILKYLNQLPYFFIFPVSVSDVQCKDNCSTPNIIKPDAQQFDTSVFLPTAGQVYFVYISFTISVQILWWNMHACE